ncbi:MAG: hypothetical protein J6Y69_07405 [Treponema sp.]|nr:hypothetical protein [Treponema sp.]
MKRICAYCLCVLTFLLVLSSCASGDYVEKDYEKNIQLLKNCVPYTTEDIPLQKQDLIGNARAQEIRSYFKDNANLDLDALMSSGKTTWEKSVDLAVFVARNIPHDNQKVQLDDRNAIILWEYSRNTPTGFNCRYHAILLSELLLSIGIKNSFVTCRPYDKNDGDCHVVNIVWLPELNKWAMIDSDMVEYTTDENGTPLSLQEMRRFIQQDRNFTVNTLPGFENSHGENPYGQFYMQAYWAKNLYWFTLYKVYAFDLEYARNLDGTRVFISEYITLVPPDYDVTDSFPNNQIITNDEVFWAE